MNHEIFKDNRFYFQNYKKFINKKIYKKITYLPRVLTCFDAQKTKIEDVRLFN